MENSVTEYKRELTKGFEKEVVAFLNSDGGVIFIGVEDDGSISGVADVDSNVLAIVDRLKSNIAPSTMGLFKVSPERAEDKTYIKVTVSSGLEKPYYVKKYGLTSKGCFMRIGSQAAPMPETMIDKLYSGRILNTLFNVVSPKQKLSLVRLRSYYAKLGVDTGHFFEENLELKTTDGKYNYLAYLMSDNNRVSLKAIEYHGEDRHEMLSEKEFGRRCIIDAAKNLIADLNRLLSDSYGVSSAALNEALLNAVIHNDYLAGGDYPVVEIFSDRLEITSAGGLPYGITTEEFFLGRSHPRNRELVRIFNEIGIPQLKGLGLRKLVELVPRENFEISANFLTVRLYFKNQDFALKNRDTGAEKPLRVRQSPTQKKLLKMIKNDGELTISEMAEKLNMSVSGVRKALAVLQSQGLIARQGAKKNGVWILL